MATSLEGILTGLAKEQFGLIIGIGVGSALAAALEPQLVAIRQAEWDADPNVAPDAYVLAAGVAQGQVDEDRAKEWARKNGIDESAFDALVNVANVGPAIGMAMQSFRRDDLTREQFRTALHRAGIEEAWWDALEALKEERLEPGAIATAVHRGIMRGAGLIVAEPPQAPGKVPHVPQSDLDAREEAAAHGLDPERLRILVGNTGLPLALGEMLTLRNRGKATDDDVKRAVANSNIRNEYMDVALELRHQLPTARDFLENALRGYSSLAEALDGAALHGMSAEYATLIYQNQGRPMVPRQITTALARGGKFEPEPGEITDPYRAAIVEGNLKPAYYDLAYANRYTLPSAFVLRTLAQTGDLTEEETHTLLLESGWPPWLAAKVAAKWAGGTGAKADPHVGRAQTQLWTALHKSYVSEESDDAIAGSMLSMIDVPGDAQGEVLRLWQAERDLVRRTLTPTQVKKAYGATTFTREEAVTRLERMGYSPADATVFLDE